MLFFQQTTKFINIKVNNNLFTKQIHAKKCNFELNGTSKKELGLKCQRIYAIVFSYKEKTNYDFYKLHKFKQKL